MRQLRSYAAIAVLAGVGICLAAGGCSRAGKETTGGGPAVSQVLESRQRAAVKRLEQRQNEIDGKLKTIEKQVTELSAQWEKALQEGDEVKAGELMAQIDKLGKESDELEEELDKVLDELAKYSGAQGAKADTHQDQPNPAPSAQVQ